MQSITYISCEQLPCIGTSQSPIVLCIDPAVSLVSTHHTVSGFLLVSENITDDCDRPQYWRYTFSYDESQLTDPTTPLTTAQIKGVFCETCFTDWIKELIG